MNTLPVLGLTQTWWGVDQVVRWWVVATAGGLLLAGRQRGGGQAVVVFERVDHGFEVVGGYGESAFGAVAVDDQDAWGVDRQGGGEQRVGFLVDPQVPGPVAPGGD